MLSLVKCGTKKKVLPKVMFQFTHDVFEKSYVAHINSYLVGILNILIQNYMFTKQSEYSI